MMIPLPLAALKTTSALFFGGYAWPNEWFDGFYALPAQLHTCTSRYIQFKMKTAAQKALSETLSEEK